MRRIIFFSLFILIAISSVPVMACGGGPPPPTLEETIPFRDYVIRGHIVDSDDLQQNYLVEVETYVAGGEGPRYLLVSNSTISVIQGDLEAITDCDDTPRPLPENESFYMALNRNPVLGFYDLRGHYIFAKSADEAEFLAMVARVTGDTPTMPDALQPYPTKAPLLIVTESGTEYVLPVDGGLPVLINSEAISDNDVYPIYRQNRQCERLACVILAENGRSAAVALTDSGFLLSFFHQINRGQDLLFSLAGSAAVWDRDTLLVYDAYARLPAWIAEWTGYREPQRSTTIVPDADVYGSEFARWNVDGTLLAYSDADGLWVWNVFAPNSEPELLLTITHYGIPYPLEFSPHGRFLSVTIPGIGQRTFDLLTRREYPYARFSPNERFVLVQQRIRMMEGYYQALSWSDVPDFLATEPLADSAPGTILDGDLGVDCDYSNGALCAIDAQDWGWLDDETAVIRADVTPLFHNGKIVSEPKSYIWFVTQPTSNISWQYWWRFSDYSSMQGLDFAVAHGDLAVLVDSSTISINRGVPMNLNLDSPITEIRWMPTLFFDH